MKNFNDLLIYSNKTIFDAIRIIDSTEHRSCFVINKSKKLIGSITDGDIRRGLLKKFDFKNSLLKICNKKSIFLNKKNEKKNINKNGVNCIPIFDGKKKVIDIKILKKKNNNNITTALIMAGGKGTRLLPLTKKTPKPLIKIKGKTLIESLILKLQKEGFQKINISINYMGSKIKKYLLKKKVVNVNNLEFIEEKKPLGTAGAIKYLKLKNDNFLLVNCDIKLNVDFSRIIDFHLLQKSDITIISKRFVNKSNFGVLDLDSKFNVKSMQEKPITVKYINTGAYLIKKKIMNIIKKDQFLDMDNLIKLALKKKYKVKSYPLYENWIDLGKLNKLLNYKKNDVLY